MLICSNKDTRLAWCCLQFGLLLGSRLLSSSRLCLVCRGQIGYLNGDLVESLILAFFKFFSVIPVPAIHSFWNVTLFQNLLYYLGASNSRGFQLTFTTVLARDPMWGLCCLSRMSVPIIHAGHDNCGGLQTQWFFLSRCGRSAIYFLIAIYPYYKERP